MKRRIRDNYKLLNMILEENEDLMKNICLHPDLQFEYIGGQRYWNVVRSTGNKWTGKCTGKHLLFWKYTGNVLEFQK